MDGDEPVGLTCQSFTSVSLDPALVPEMPYLKKLGNRGMARIISYLCEQRFAVPQLLRKILRGEPLEP